MFSPTSVVIEAFVERLRENYLHVYGLLEPEFPNILGFVGRLTLENIAGSDAPYHDMTHTIMVTEVGQEILKGKHIVEGGVSPSDWLNFVVALLCHDIGYVRGVCRDDGEEGYVSDDKGGKVTLPSGATDASMTPYHVNRSQIFVRERFSQVPQIDHQRIIRSIEFTRFPMPDGREPASESSYPGMLRAADLIGQMADIDYLRKAPRLFAEFQEIGANDTHGYNTPADLRSAYPRFFWSMVRPYIGASLRYLEVTQEGKQWVANLYAHVFSQEHSAPAGEA